MSIDLIHLRRDEFGDHVQLTGLCLGPDDVLFATGLLGPSPDFGNPLRIGGSSKYTRLGHGLKASFAVAFDRSTGTLIISANDGTTPGLSTRVPNGIFRIAMDGSCEVVTREVTRPGPFAVAVDGKGNIYYPDVRPNTQGWSILRRAPDGNVSNMASGFVNIVGLSADMDGNLFVADAENSFDEGVLLFIPAVQAKPNDIRVWVCEYGLRPHAITADDMGHAYFSNVTGDNLDVSQIYKADQDGNITLVADGLVRGNGLAFDRTKGILYALNFMNFVTDQSPIHTQYHNDTLLLSLTGANERIPEPFYQPGELPQIAALATAAAPTGSPGTDVSSSLPTVSTIEGNEHGPLDLADCVIGTKKSFVDKVFPFNSSRLSHETIRRLISLAYHASCLEEEGQFPRFRIIAGTNWGSHYSVDLGPFPNAVDDARDLRKLAPAAAFRGSAIVFDEGSLGHAGRLICRGISDSEDLIANNDVRIVGSLEDVFTIKGSALVIRVEGPAYLKASFVPGPVFSLRGGHIRELQRLSMLPEVQSVFSEVGEWQYARLPKHDDRRLRTFFRQPLVLAQIMSQLWARVLWHVADRRRGGTFVVIPRARGHWRHAEQFELKLGYKATISVASILVSQILSCLKYSSEGGPGYGEIFQLRWKELRFERERLIRMVADLANVDGCVVLDRRLNIIGFGAKITTPVAYIERFGTRHGSAMAWCQKHGGLAFVISQDGDLRVFSSDRCEVPDAVDAGTSLLELW